MGAPELALYPLLVRLLGPLVGVSHAASLTALADLVWALLVAQSLHPAALVRALPTLATSRARQGFRRVRRLLERGSLQSQVLTPALVRAALRLVDDAEVLLVLDRSRCLRWEVLTLGVPFHGGRVLPIAWAVLPSPWPTGQVTPTVLALLERVVALWPTERPVHLVADRGFPCSGLVRLLDEWRQRRPLGTTIRVRAGDWVRLSTAATWQAVVTRYTGRFSTEGTSRDGKRWGWEAVVGQATTAGLVDGLTGLAAVGAIIQATIGAAAGRTREAGRRARQPQWTTTDRLSVFSRGRLVLHDRAHAWTPWLGHVLTDLTARLTAGAATDPAAAPTPLPQHPPLPEAA